MNKRTLVGIGLDEVQEARGRPVRDNRHRNPGDYVRVIVPAYRARAEDDRGLDGDDDRKDAWQSPERERDEDRKDRVIRRK